MKGFAWLLFCSTPLGGSVVIGMRINTAHKEEVLCVFSMSCWQITHRYRDIK
uniref:Uncharacterized protein n=1 Tax=Anguilla anguilla TaxID=7936 RepID=A0A0E9VS40_ANGAN